MKTSNVGTWAIVYGTVLAVVIGILLWSSYSEQRMLNHEIETLKSKMKGLSGQTTELERLAIEAGALESYVNDTLKTIPESADVARLIGRLSLPVDGETVLDQTFTRGRVGAPAGGGNEQFHVMPLTIDIEATFESVMSVIDAAESLRRLVRVSSVRMHFPREDDLELVDRPFVKASLGLEAVYQAPEEEGPS